MTNNQVPNESATLPEIDLGAVSENEVEQQSETIPITPQHIAQEITSFVEEHCAEQLTPQVWEAIRDYAITKSGMPIRHIEGMKPMDTAAAKKFEESLMPCGKYLGQKIKTILKKDRNYLEQFIKQPSQIQVRIKKFLIYLEGIGK